MKPFKPSKKSSSSKEFDVFLSFRGTDTRHGFASHLFEALRERQIRTFMDDDNLERGERLKDRILQAIESSELCIPILSQGYAESEWCLMELAEIVRKKKKIIPVFYHVDPSDVRKQRGPFGAAFDAHQRRFDNNTVTEWRKAMAEVGYISGYDAKNVANGYTSLSSVFPHIFSRTSNWPPQLLYLLKKFNHKKSKPRKFDILASF